jgi:hypothetical protein
MSRNDVVPKGGRELHPKKWVVIVVTLLPVLGIACGYAFDNYALPPLKDWLAQRNTLDPSGTPFRNAVLLATPLALMAATGWGVAGYFWLMAARIFHTKEFPPRGYPVLAKTTVLQGRAAFRKAYQLIFFGLLSIAMVGYVFWALIAIFPESINLLRPLYG